MALRHRRRRHRAPSPDGLPQLLYLDLTALGRQEAWEEPTGRAVPRGLHVGGPAMRLPDAYDA
ncbi:hypothetical protein ACWGQL_11630 [Streptomyces lydicus]